MATAAEGSRAQPAANRASGSAAHSSDCVGGFSVEHDNSAGSLSPLSNRVVGMQIGDSPLSPDLASSEPTSECAAPSSDRKPPPPQNSDNLKFSSLMNKYVELSSEIDYTEDMEAKFEQQLAAIRARKTLLREVQQETESMLKGGKSSDRHHVPGSRSTLSSPGLSVQSKSSMSTLPPGFEGSSIPLQPQSVPIGRGRSATMPAGIDPFNPPEKMPSYFYPASQRPPGDAVVFKEGNLITVCSNSGSSDDEMDNQAALEELTRAFKLANESRDSEMSHMFQEDLSQQSLLDKFLKSHNPEQEDVNVDITKEVEIKDAIGAEEAVRRDDVIDGGVREREPAAAVGERKLTNGRPASKRGSASSSEQTKISVRPANQTAPDHSDNDSDRDDVESLKSEIFILRTKIQKLANYTPEHANQKVYKSKVEQVESQLKSLEELITSSKSQTGPASGQKVSSPVEPVAASRPVQEDTGGSQRKERHNYTKLILEHIHKMRQLNLQLLKDKISRKQLKASEAENEDLMLLTQELELHQQKIMELEQRLGNWHLHLLELNSSNDSELEPPGRWAAMRQDLHLLALESDNTFKLVHLALIRQHKLRAQLRTAAADQCQPAAAASSSPQVEQSEVKPRKPQSKPKKRLPAGGSASASPSQSVWIERQDRRRPTPNNSGDNAGAAAMSTDGEVSPQVKNMQPQQLLPSKLGRKGGGLSNQASSVDASITRQSSTESEITKITGRKEDSDSNSQSLEEGRLRMSQRPSRNPHSGVTRSHQQSNLAGQVAPPERTSSISSPRPAAAAAPQLNLEIRDPRLHPRGRTPVRQFPQYDTVGGSSAMSSNSKVKQQPKGLIVVERPKSQDAQRQANGGTGRDIVKGSRSRSVVSLSSAPFFRETSFVESSPRTINLLENQFLQTSRESLISQMSRNPQQSPYNSRREQLLASERDPRATPIMLDGGNLFSTNKGIYRIKTPVNDLEGNDRRKEQRRVHLETSGGGGYAADETNDGTKSDSELLAWGNNQVQMMYHKPKKSKRAASFKDKLSKFTKELEQHLLPDIPDTTPPQRGSMQYYNGPPVGSFTSPQGAPMSYSQSNQQLRNMSRSTDQLPAHRSTGDLSRPGHSGVPMDQSLRLNSSFNGLGSQSQPGDLETSFPSNQMDPADPGSGKMCATPCYYRTLPNNKIQVIYPDSNQIFQYTYSRSLPPANKKSSTQIIQQVQPDGSLSEEKLYFFDPIQLNDGSVDSRGTQNSIDERDYFIVDGRTVMGYGDKTWFSKKKSTMKSLVKLTKELIK